jgi:hypothetical protein
MRCRERRVGLALIFAQSVITFVGCGDDSTTSSNTPTVSQETAQQQSAVAMAFIDGLVNSIDQVVLMDFTGGLGGVAAVHRISESYDGIARDDLCLLADCAGKPTYGSGAWTASCNNTSTDCAFNANVFVRFQDAAGSSQEVPDDTTDKLTYNVNVLVDYYVAGTAPRAADYLDVVFGFDSDMTVDAIQTETWRANGSGGMTFDIRAEQQGQTYAAAASLGWTYLLTVPANGTGCPEGTVTITIGQYTATAVYAGGAYTLTLYEGGNQVYQETGVSSC